MIPTESNEAATLIIDGIFATIGFLSIWVLKSLQKSVEAAKDSIDELNVKVAMVIEKTANHEKQLDSHSDRIRELELTKK